MSLRSHVQRLPIHSRIETPFANLGARGFAVTEGSEQI